MVTVADALSVLFPNADPLRDYTVADDGTGARIVAWNLTDPQPTADQLAAVTADQVTAAKTVALLTAAATSLAASATVDHVAIRAADAAEWTFGRNDVAEHNQARWALLYDALGLTPPTAAQIAAQITANRALVAVDPAAPDAAGVADRGGRRLIQSEILVLIGGVLEAGGGLPTG